MAVNDSGLVFALLNGPEPVGGRRRVPPTSRGLIIPRLAGCRTLDDVEIKLGEIDPAQYRAWRLVVVSTGVGIDAMSNGRTLR